MKSSVWLFGLAGVVVVGLIGFAVWKGSQPVLLTPFAQCLTDNGVKMYGAWWCPHCKAQKELFEGAFDDVEYVECSDASKRLLPVCTDKNITTVPVWEFADGSMLKNVQDLETLAEKTSCEIPTTP